MWDRHPVIKMDVATKAIFETSYIPVFFKGKVVCSLAVSQPAACTGNYVHCTAGALVRFSILFRLVILFIKNFHLIFLVS